MSEAVLGRVMNSCIWAAVLLDNDGRRLVPECSSKHGCGPKPQGTLHNALSGLMSSRRRTLWFGQLDWAEISWVWS